MSEYQTALLSGDNTIEKICVGQARIKELPLEFELAQECNLYLVTIPKYIRLGF